jgi:hypothetical protein
VLGIIYSNTRNVRFLWPSGLKARVCGLCLAGTADSNSAGGMDVCVACVVQ